MEGLGCPGVLKKRLLDVHFPLATGLDLSLAPLPEARSGQEEGKGRGRHPGSQAALPSALF